MGTAVRFMDIVYEILFAAKVNYFSRLMVFKNDTVAKEAEHLLPAPNTSTPHSQTSGACYITSFNILTTQLIHFWALTPKMDQTTRLTMDN